MASSDPWIQTFTGRRFCPGAPTASMIDVRDVAHHLSLLCRFTGAVRRFYSVAEHSVLMAQYFESRGDALPAKYALLHDATEAYLNDIARPVKHLANMDGYRKLEERCWSAVASRFGLGFAIPEAVHQADIGMFRAEYAALMAPAPDGYTMSFHEVAPLPVEIRCWTPEEAEFQFLKTFGRLFK